MRHPAVVILLAVMLLEACGDRDSKKPADTPSPNANISAVVTPPPPLKPSSAVDPNFKPCNPYYPLVPGSLAKYNLFYASGLVADVTVVVEAAQQNPRKVFTQIEQIVDRSGGSNKLSMTRRTCTCAGENIQVIDEKGDNKVEQYQNRIETTFSDQAFLMVAASDLKPGRTWSQNMTTTLQSAGGPPIPLDPTTRYLEFGGREAVNVPAGKFTAVKINWKLKESSGSDYYARGLGLVRRVLNDGTSWELTEYSGLAYIE